RQRDRQAHVRAAGHNVMERPADRSSAAEAAELATAQAGDPEAFRRLTDTHRRELHPHCYRMLGSCDDAEDEVRETMVRAWRRLATFEDRSPFRAWVYRIAPNVCLPSRSRRPAPPREVPTRPNQALLAGPEPAINSSPYPDALLDELVATS